MATFQLWGWLLVSKSLLIIREPIGWPNLSPRSRLCSLGQRVGSSRRLAEESDLCLPLRLDLLLAV